MTNSRLGGKLYAVGDRALSQSDASEACRQDGGYLTVPNTAAEFDHLKQYFVQPQTG